MESTSLPIENCDSTPHPLHFDKEGNFRILTLSDIHGETDQDIESTSFIQEIIQKTKPNLIVLLGDQISKIKNEGNNIQIAIANVMKPITESKIPFAVVFGNHDIDCGMTLEEQMEIYQSYPGCLARPNNIINQNLDSSKNQNDILFNYETENISVSGCGNYNLLIKDSKKEKFIFNLWFADSGSVDSIFIKPDQVEWYDKIYQKMLHEVNLYNEGSDTTPKQIHSLWFMHRSIDEIYNFFNTSDFPVNTTAVSKGYRFGSYLSLKTKKDNPKLRFEAGGLLLEGPDLPDFRENVSDLYNHWLRNGDVLGACFGHDHGNSFYGFTEDNIGLGFDSAAGFSHAYPFPGVERGARIFDINEKDTTRYCTQMIYCSEILKNKKIGILEKMITHGHYSEAIVFLKKALFPRFLQKIVGKKVLGFLKKSFCPEHMK